MIKLKKSEQGFALIEILIGLGLFAVIFLGTSYLMLDNLQASFDNQEKIKADFLVVEGLEAVKAIAGNDWDQVQPGTYGLKLEDNKWRLIEESEMISQMSKNGERIITISEFGDDNLKKVDSKVVWFNVLDKIKESNASTILANWHNYVSICSDGIDNDGDGAEDYPEDPGCDSPEDEDEYNPNNPPQLPDCFDGIDNDNDGIVDYPNDPGCESASDEDEVDPLNPPQCSDNLDNDSDGNIDYPNDSGCESANDEDEVDPLNPPQCSDNFDNDGDGNIDYPNDSDCDSASDDDETNSENHACSDNIDNDNDGIADYPDDPGCDSADDDDETNPQNPPELPQCSDGIDNDNDGIVDFPYDMGCESAIDDDETGPVCGNGVMEAAEECDDNNLKNDDGCSSQCVTEIESDLTCGNGILDKDEECDSSENVNNCKQAIESCQHNCKCKVPICHATSSEINPYVLISVDYHAVDGNGKNDHSHHPEDIIPIWDVNNDGKLEYADCMAALKIYPRIIFDNEDMPLCKLDEDTISVTGKVFLPALQIAKLQLSYYVVWPENKRTEITYVNKGLVKSNDTFSIVTPWPGVSLTDEKVETHIQATLLDPITGESISGTISSLNYYWYHWVCPAR